MRTGGCQCGAVRYRITGTPLASGICHCRTCQKIASAPSLPFITLGREQFVHTHGTPAEVQSSARVTRGFCGRCGSPLTYRSDDDPDKIDVMTCSLDDASAWPPTFHVWVSEKPAWDPIRDGLPAFAKSRSDG